jgi:hypothetical protein
MAQNRMGHKPGGGLHSRNVRHSTAPKVEPRAKRIREPAVAQIGGSYGDHVTNTKGPGTGWRPGSIYGGKGYSNPVGPTNMALSGPGSGRTIYKTGTQCQTGTANPGTSRPQSQGRGILTNE